jgi:hypothetical protein
MPDEELNPNGTPSTPPTDDDGGVPSGESPEGADQQGDKIIKSSESEVPEGYTKGLDGLLYNQEYPEDRFKGMFGAWQKDHQELIDFRTAKAKAESSPTPTGQDEATAKWLDWLFGEYDKRNSAKAEAENAVAKAELDRVLIAYPKLEADNVLDTAIKYKTDLATAAQILEDINRGVSAKAGLSNADYAKKMAAGKIAGKPGAPQKAGLTPFDPTKSIADNVSEGRKELGV